MQHIIFNGEVVKRDDVKVDIEDRGFQFGDGVYEVIRIYNGRPFALTEHLDRLYESAEKIYMKIPYSKTDIVNLINQILEKESRRTCNLYMQVSRGVSVRNHIIPKDSKATLVAYLLEGERPLKTMEKGISALLADDTRWLHCEIKSISLLGSVLAKHKAVEAGCGEAILHRDGIVTEGSSTNVWIVKDGVLKTHPANNLILNGITRQIIIKICQEQQIPYSETAFTTDDLLNADEAFISSTTQEVVPVIKVNETAVNNGQPGPVTKQLQQLFAEKIEKECGVLTV